jgi:hypothetical protein
MTQNSLPGLSKGYSLSSQKAADVRRPRLLEIAFGVLLLFVFLIGWYIGSTCTNKLTVLPLKHQAIERGFAEWQVIDQQVGTTEFVWKQQIN